MGKLMITVMLAFAEYERDIIVERTQTGKAVARANGKRVDGRPKKFKPEQIAHALEMLVYWMRNPTTYRLSVGGTFFPVKT